MMIINKSYYNQIVEYSIGGYVQKGGHCAAKQIEHKTMMQMSIAIYMLLFTKMDYPSSLIEYLQKVPCVVNYLHFVHSYLHLLFTWCLFIQTKLKLWGLCAMGWAIYKEYFLRLHNCSASKMLSLESSRSCAAHLDFSLLNVLCHCWTEQMVLSYINATHVKNNNFEWSLWIIFWCHLHISNLFDFITRCWNIYHITKYCHF